MYTAVASNESAGKLFVSVILPAVAMETAEHPSPADIAAQGEEKRKR